MKTSILYTVFIIAVSSAVTISCKKEKQAAANDPYNLDVNLTGSGNATGSILFRQDPDTIKIVTLETKVDKLLPNHEYLLQRAVDTQIDGNCTGTMWLTLGKGLTPRSIFTDPYGKGTEILWRDLSALASGTVFDIHFQILDAANMSILLNSGCHQYTVR